MGNEIQPETNRALRNLGLLYCKFMGFNWIVKKYIVLLVKGTILQVDDCRSDKVISQNHVIIPNFYLQNCIFWQLNDLVNFLHELGIIAIFKILIFEL